MVTIVRLALLIVLGVLALAAVVAAARTETGIVEKLALLALAGALVWLGATVRRFRRYSRPSSAA